MFPNFQGRMIQTSSTHIYIRMGGSGPPLLLLHGYPQTHIMWHRIAPQLAKHFTVVCTDLRGYGDSGHPPTDSEHRPYSKRSAAQDQVDVMTALGFKTFMVAGHDRGGRVLHRLLLDHPSRVTRAAMLDIVPTRHIFQTIDQSMATIYEHWFFLIQPDCLPERMIGHDPDWYLTTKLKRWSSNANAFTPEAMAEYLRCFRRPETIHTTCEDYRAAATIDLSDDEADLNSKIQCPLLVLWGAYGAIEKHYDVISIWQNYANTVEGTALPCGHFLAEEAPEQTYQALVNFFMK
ncbi:alpha/beta fold hydrolase [Leptothoe spongobia]|uniref:Alpha/beta hydrolase n=1 Tax=Leptothoe spongobia TAU-MAC 1115 TaxID=1967444 RepID=A0A947DJA5_9CYAN|nr:alpha/beta hydrolase [Leptothoe spongobia]MBT9317460.1 alpha/beta hydrolase [Leptothoe spongobia TAU-MAC 1115]